MMGKKSVSPEKQTIDTKKIYETHAQIKEIVMAYKDVNLKVNTITQRVKENWVGSGCNEYKLLIRKIDDFGETLQEIYDALVHAEVQYETADDKIRQQFAMAMDS